MKNFLLFFTFVICFIPCSYFYVSAENAGIIQSDTIIAKSGDIVDIGISINNNPGIIAICLDISYDNQSLELSGVDNCELFEDSTFTPSGDFKLIPFRIMWMNALTKSNYTSNGNMAILHFKVLDTASEGLSEINISVEDKNTFNVELKDVYFEVINGGVDIKTSSEKASDFKKGDIKLEDSITENVSVESVKRTNNEYKEVKYILPIDKICEKVSEDYEAKTGEAPSDMEVVNNIDGTLSIILKNEDGSIIDTYSIDPETGKGTDSNGNKLNISENKEFPIANFVFIVMGLISAFSLIIYKFFMIRKDKKHNYL